MGQISLEGNKLGEVKPFWIIDGEDCRYWFEETGSEEYKQKKRKYGQKAYQRWRKKPESKEKERKQKRKQYKKFLDWIWSIRKPKCVCCREYDKRLLQFHHIYKPKLFAITVGYASSRARVLIELRKCIVLCSNCHIMITNALGKHITKPLSEVIPILNHQPYHPMMKWLIFLLPSDIYPQTDEEWYKVWG